MATHKISRRTFIAGSGALLAAHLAAACATDPVTETAAPVAATPIPPSEGAPSPEAVAGCPPQPDGPVLTDIPADAGERPVGQIVYNTPSDYRAETGMEITQYCEAPQLAEMVARGELPPIDERLPQEPVVVQPDETIGKYGGYMTTPVVGESLTDPGVSYMAWLDPLTSFSPQGETIPNVIQSWEISDDATEITLHVRRGLRWSDGEPYTAEDIIYWFEHHVLNTDLTPTPPSILTRHGELCEVTKIDDFAVKFGFAAPYGLFITYLGRWGGPRGITNICRHYLSQYHTDFVELDSLRPMMGEEGFEEWSDFYNYMASNENPDKPSVYAWLPNARPPQPIQTYRRNPYYWKVDTAGNQLPYIDELRSLRMGDWEAVLLKTIAGELDWPGGIPGGMANLPILHDYQDEIGYRFAYGLWMPNAFCNIMFNFSHAEEARRELYNDVRFRRALSVAIDREEMIQLIWKGGVFASQVAPLQGPPYYGESDLFKAYTQFDPDLANSLLDEAGLTARGSDGYRLGLDGQPLLLVIAATTAWPAETPEVMELVAGYWDKVGIRATVRPEAGPLWAARHSAGEHDLSARGAHFGGGPVHPTLNSNTFALSGWQWAPDWALWLDTNGERGAEPPDDVKRIREIREEVLAESDPDVQDELIMEVFRIQMDNLWSIGLVVDDPAVSRMIVVHNRIRNVPTRLASFEFQPNVPPSFFVNE